MQKRWVFGFTAVAMLSTLAVQARAQAAELTVQQLQAGFLNPPDNAKPMVRWWWFGPAVTKPELKRELEQMKADGIGGAELAFVYPEVVDGKNPKGVGTGNGEDVFKNLPFLSPEMLDAVNFAQAEGRRLGLRIDVTLCSGWPYGGPNTTPKNAARRLVVQEVAVPPNATKVALPNIAPNDDLIAASIANGEPKHWDISTATPLALQIPTDVSYVVVAPSNEKRVALFFVDGHTRQQVKRAAVGADGPVLDPFSREAVAQHLEKVGEPLVKAFGATPPYAIFSDSLEAYGADWTPTLPEEFKKRRGYDLLPLLPLLVAGGTPEADKVRHDWGVTLTELVNENYMTQINDWAKAHGTKFRSQTYGEPAVDLSSQRLVALPEGEGPQWRAFSTLRWAASGNHLFGNNVTSGETFTWLHSPVFRATPLDMKAEADIDFIMGENQLMFHGWPYSPPPNELEPGDPGWSLYAAAVFNDHNPWHPVMPAVTKYIQRMSWLLRQGKPANQVALLLPTDDAWASFVPGHVTVTGALQKLVTTQLMSAILSAGYNVDFIDAKTIERGGLKDYQLLVLPPTERIPVAALAKIGEWRKQQYAMDAKRQYDVLCYQRCPSIDPEGKPLPGMTGSFLVADNADALAKDMHDAIAPDFRLADDASENARMGLGFIRRKLKDADVYYVVNTSNLPVETHVSFATKFSHGGQWNPETGRVQAEPYSVTTKGLPLVLAPYESATFVFGEASKPALTPHGPIETVADLTMGWNVSFTGLAKSEQEDKLTDWMNDEATLHYSGEAVYTKDFKLDSMPASGVSLEIDGGTSIPGAPNSAPEHNDRAASPVGADGMPNPLITRTGPGMHAWFEPPVREAALVFVNGQEAGALWHPPYRVDVSKLLKAGQNYIEIRVYNTALNAWSALTPRDYKPLIAVYGDRFQMQDLKDVKPLPSGILGTVKLVTETAQ